MKPSTRRCQRSLAALLLALCAAATGAAGPEPELAGAKYYSVQADPRLCPAPFCGGVFVSLLNHRLTRCHDGQKLEVCHASDVDWSRLGLEPAALADFQTALYAGRAVARGRLLPGRPVGGFGDLGLFVVTEGWIAASEAPPTGRYFRVTDRGIVCITAPCFSLRQQLLNTVKRRDLSNLDLSPADASEAAVEAALEQLREKGILVAGLPRVVPDAGPAGDGLELVASQFYLRLGAPER